MPRFDGTGPNGAGGYPPQRARSGRGPGRCGSGGQSTGAGVPDRKPGRGTGRGGGGAGRRGAPVPAGPGRDNVGNGNR